jgi:hypothetical protein
VASSCWELNTDRPARSLVSIPRLYKCTHAIRLHVIQAALAFQVFLTVCSLTDGQFVGITVDLEVSFWCLACGVRLSGPRQGVYPPPPLPLPLQLRKSTSIAYSAVFRAPLRELFRLSRSLHYPLPPERKASIRVSKLTCNEHDRPSPNLVVYSPRRKTADPCGELIPDVTCDPGGRAMQ